MKDIKSVARRFVSGGKLVCATALGLSLAAFGLAPGAALAGDAAAAPGITDLSQLLGTAEDEDEAVEQGGFVDEWVLVRIASESEGIDLDLSGLAGMDDLGYAITLKINADGTFVMAGSFEGQDGSAEGTWEQVSADTASLVSEGEAIDFVLQDDGTLVVSEDGMMMAFARASEAADGSAAAESQYVADPKGFVYTWKLVAMDLPGEDNDIPEELFSFAEVIGFKGLLVFNEDGTFSLEVSQGDMGESQSISGEWTSASPTDATLTVEGQYLTAAIADGRLALGSPEDADTVLLFAALDPSAVPATADQLYLGEWHSDALVGEDYGGGAPVPADYELYVYDDGTFDMYYYADGVEDTVTGAWTYDAQWDEATFSANGSDLKAFVEDNELYMDYDGVNYIVFVR